jgi:hypothetical protein
VAGLLDPVSRSAPHGLHVRLTAPDEAETVLTVPIAPGLVVPVGVAEANRVGLGEAVELEPTAGSLALDGEREIELGPSDEVEVRLDPEGPLTIDVGAVMREAARAAEWRAVTSFGFPDIRPILRGYAPAPTRSAAQTPMRAHRRRRDARLNTSLRYRPEGLSPIAPHVLAVGLRLFPACWRLTAR